MDNAFRLTLWLDLGCAWGVPAPAQREDVPAHAYRVLASQTPVELYVRLPGGCYELTVDAVTFSVAIANGETIVVRAERNEYAERPEELPQHYLYFCETLEEFGKISTALVTSGCASFGEFDSKEEEAKYNLFIYNSPFREVRLNSFVNPTQQ
jgi:hypothetical protein